jgi:hypothetical protein
MEVSLQQLEKNIAETWQHLDRQRHIIAILREHGDLRDVPTAEVMLETLTASLEVLCERKAILLGEIQPATESTPRLRLNIG